MHVHGVQFIVETDAQAANNGADLSLSDLLNILLFMLSSRPGCLLVTPEHNTIQPDASVFGKVRFKRQLDKCSSLKEPHV